MYYANTVFKDQDIAAPRGGGEGRGKDHFSGFSSFFFFLRGWGGVFNIRCRTSSMVRFGSSSLRGFLSIGKSSGNQKNPSNKDALLNWVADFLNYWEDEPMLYWQAAEIIVNQILISQNPLQDGQQMERDQMPGPETFF